MHTPSISIYDITLSREAVEEEKIVVTYIPTGENVADIFMKALARPKFEGFVGKLGLKREKEKSEKRSMV